MKLDLLYLMNRSSDGNTPLSAVKTIRLEGSIEVDDFSVMVDLVTPIPTPSGTQETAQEPGLQTPASGWMHEVTEPRLPVQNIEKTSEKTVPEVEIDARTVPQTEPDVVQVKGREAPAVERRAGGVDGPFVQQDIKEKSTHKRAVALEQASTEGLVPVIRDNPKPAVHQEKDQVISRARAVAADPRQRGADVAIIPKPSPEARKGTAEVPPSQERVETATPSKPAKKATSIEATGPQPRTASPISQMDVSPKLVSDLPDPQAFDPPIVRASTAIDGAAPSRPLGAAGPPTPPTAPSIPGQIAATLSVSETGMAEIVLDPEELGKVRLTLTQTDGRTVLIVEAQRPETIDLMRRNLDELTAEFSDAGYANLSFDFRDSPQDWNDRDSGTMTAFEAEDFETGEDLPNDLAVLTMADRLDLRL
ncbi:flagellar hook-length control protein FliK [Aestuariibius sp. 2305UL40-4]|uniref:flagellar hook-length control protein FliK n=1 Tax=Aestuariibius violaceus TaxID=3234132 RepID=UPI00345E99EC